MEQKGRTIGTRLREARLNNNLTIPQVSACTSISKGNLSTLETDKSKPSSDALIILSKLYEVTTDWILKGNGTIQNVKMEKKESPELFIPQVPNKELEIFFHHLALEWEKVDNETRGWIIVQLRNAFPIIAKKVKKRMYFRLCKWQ